MSSNRDLSALGEAPGLRNVGRGIPGCCFQGPGEQIDDNRKVCGTWHALNHTGGVATTTSASADKHPLGPGGQTDR